MCLTAELWPLLVIKASRMMQPWGWTPGLGSTGGSREAISAFTTEFAEVMGVAWVRQAATGTTQGGEQHPSAEQPAIPKSQPKNVHLSWVLSV